MTNKEREKKNLEDPEPMVLYDCPYCGSATLKSIIDIRNNDTWVCPHCGKHMKVA